MNKLKHWIIGVVLLIACFWFLTASWGRPQVLHDIHAKITRPNFQVTARAPFAFIVSVDVLRNTPLEYGYRRTYYFWFFGYYTAIN